MGQTQIHHNVGLPMKPLLFAINERLADFWPTTPLGRWVKKDLLHFVYDAEKS